MFTIRRSPALFAATTSRNEKIPLSLIADRHLTSPAPTIPVVREAPTTGRAEAAGGTPPIAINARRRTRVVTVLVGHETVRRFLPAVKASANNKK